MDEGIAVEAPELNAEAHAAGGQFRSTTLEPVIVITRPDDETLNVAVEYGGQAGEDIGVVGRDDTRFGGTDTMSQVADVAKALGEALGVRVEER